MYSFLIRHWTSLTTKPQKKDTKSFEWHFSTVSTPCWTSGKHQHVQHGHNNSYHAYLMRIMQTKGGQKEGGWTTQSVSKDVFAECHFVTQSSSDGVTSNKIKQKNKTDVFHISTGLVCLFRPNSPIRQSWILHLYNFDEIELIFQPHFQT